jgi:hypothetical protein
MAVHNPADYAAISPKWAQLKASEQHLHTFKCSLCIRQGWPIKQLVDTTKYFALHITNKRIVIEPYEPDATEGLMLKSVSWALSALADSAGQGFLTSATGAEDIGKSAAAEVITIPYSAIATVELRDNGFLHRCVGKLTENRMVEVAFKDRSVGPFWFVALPGGRSILSTRNVGPEFVKVMIPLLGS